MFYFSLILLNTTPSKLPVKQRQRVLANFHQKTNVVLNNQIKYPSHGKQPLLYGLLRVSARHFFFFLYQYRYQYDPTRPYQHWYIYRWDPPKWAPPHPYKTLVFTIPHLYWRTHRVNFIEPPVHKTAVFFI